MKLEVITNKAEKTLTKIKKYFVNNTAIITIIAIALLLCSLGYIVYLNKQRALDAHKFENLFEKSKQNYFLQSIENENLRKRLQEMNLRLTETINNMVDMQTMLLQMSSEKANLEDIRLQMQSGINKTKIQLDKMQQSVDYLIRTRSEEMKTTRDEIMEKRQQ